MPLMILAAMMMAQAPAVQPLPAPAPALKKQKPRQICEDLSITGSHVQRHVCHDANVDGATLLGISRSLDGKATLNVPAGNRGDANMTPGG